jgi:DNA-binding transcriptional MerR regulator
MSDLPDDASRPDSRSYTVNELADEAGVTRRTVHYYISQGLLPASGSEGRGTRYGQAHLDRLRLIRELQREHLPLAEIRQRTEHLNDHQVADLLAAGEALPEPRGSAFDYIQSVLAGTSRRDFAMPMRARTTSPDPAPMQAAAPPPASAVAARAQPVAAGPQPPAAVPASATAPQAPPTRGRSQWERISLAPDVELHVRRPLGRLQNRAVDRLVAFARQLLEEDPS